MLVLFSSLLKLISFVLALILFVVSSHSPAFDHLYVLEREEASILKISPVTGEILGFVNLDESPDRIVLSPHGNRILALKGGRGTHWKKSGFVPEQKSSVTIVDANSMRLISKLERVCWDISTGAVVNGVGQGGDWVFSDDGEFVNILCKGKWAKKKGNSLKKMRKPTPPKVLRVNLDTGAFSKPLAFDRPVTQWVTVPKKQRVIIFSEYKKKENKPAEIQVLDIHSWETQHKFPLEGKPGRPIISFDNDWIYLLEPGKPSKNVKKNKNGKVHVISLAKDKQVKSIEVGSRPWGFMHPRKNQLIVVSYLGPNQEKKKRDTGLVHLIRADKIVSNYETSRRPMYAHIQGDNLFIFGSQSLSLIDTSASETREIQYNRKFRNLMDVNTPYFADLVVNKVFDRAFLLMSFNPNMAYGVIVMDLENSTMKKQLIMGRPGVRFANSLGAVLLGAGLVAVTSAAFPSASSLGEAVAYSMQEDVFLQSMVQLAVMALPFGAHGNIKFRQDEKFLYVLNAASKDVTVINTTNLEIEKYLPVGGSAIGLYLLEDKQYLAVSAGKGQLRVIDTVSNTIVEERNYAGNFAYIPESPITVALSEKDSAVYFVDSATLSIKAKASGIKNPYQFVFH